jgi:tetratricopeptide (TPR) repeat protein
MKTIYASFVAAALAFPALAACPEPADTSAELLELFEHAQAAENFTEGREVSNQMWQVWLRAPDELSQSALDAGMRRRDSFDFTGARSEFDRLVEYCPLYAEGYNQRAYINFLTENYEEALVDLDKALALQPYHVAAQYGRALTLMNLGRLQEARDQMMIAVGNNPWLSERALLAKGAPLGPTGEDI